MMRSRFTIRSLLILVGAVAVFLAIAAELYRGELVKETDAGLVLIGKAPREFIEGEVSTDDLARMLLEQLHHDVFEHGFRKGDFGIVRMEINGHPIHRVTYARFCIKRLSLSRFEYTLDYEDDRARRLNRAITMAISSVQERLNARIQRDTEDKRGGRPGQALCAVFVVFQPPRLAMLPKEKSVLSRRNFPFAFQRSECE